MQDKVGKREALENSHDPHTLPGLHGEENKAICTTGIACTATIALTVWWLF